jgi:1-acyl-sn-glycerol-3-phosphate acyltransferase
VQPDNVQTVSPAVRWLRAVAMCVQVCVVWLGAVMVAPRLAVTQRNALVARFSARTLRILGVRMRVLGARPLRDGPVLVVANHVSWLDVYLLNAVLGGTRHVAKSEVARWPVAGAIARGFGTFFHARGNFRDAARVKDAVAAALCAGERVVVFPEGTTSEGEDVGPFHAAFFQAAVDARVPVQAVAVRYPGAGGRPDPAPAFVGDMTFVASLARVLRRRRLEARLTFGPVVLPADLTRRELGAVSHAFVALALEYTGSTAPRPDVLPLQRAA